jgi:hypothetical protein
MARPHASHTEARKRGTKQTLYQQQRQLFDASLEEKEAPKSVPPSISWAPSTELLVPPPVTNDEWSLWSASHDDKTVEEFTEEAFTESDDDAAREELFASTMAMVQEDMVQEADTSSWIPRGQDFAGASVMKETHVEAKEEAQEWKNIRVATADKGVEKLEGSSVLGSVGLAGHAIFNEHKHNLPDETDEAGDLDSLDGVDLDVPERAGFHVDYVEPRSSLQVAYDDLHEPQNLLQTPTAQPLRDDHAKPSAHPKIDAKSSADAKAIKESEAALVNAKLDMQAVRNSIHAAEAAQSPRHTPTVISPRGESIGKAQWDTPHGGEGVVVTAPLPAGDFTDQEDDIEDYE